MLRLAEQCDTKEWYISLAEQNWGIWPPLRGYIFGRTGFSFGRKKLLVPPKNAPGMPMLVMTAFLNVSYSEIKIQDWHGCAVWIVRMRSRRAGTIFYK